MTVHLTTTTVADQTQGSVVGARATVLPSGEALLLLQGSGPQVPSCGRLQSAGETLDWQASVWEWTELGETCWRAMAVVEALPRGDGILVGADGGTSWIVHVASRVSASVPDLIAQAQAVGADMVAIFHVLADLHARCRQAGGSQLRPMTAFVQDFLESVAIRDGFIELIAEPQTGGLFLQGWTQTLGTGPLHWISLDDPLAEPDLAIAVFDRPDLLSPAKGLCLFHKGLGLQVAALAAGFVEQNGRLLRLDMVSATVPSLSGARASEHVAQMIPRMHGRPADLASFHRICRPLYTGEDTLSATPLPIAIGLDAVLRGPDSTLLVVGWMLDPDALAEMVLIKSRSNRYARISDDWVRLPRSDLAQAFANDPRFMLRFREQVTLSGFLVRVPPVPDPAGDLEDLYVEIVLQDHRCLFRPMPKPTPLDAERLMQVLEGISPTEPELARIIDDHLVPVLGQLQPAPPAARRGAASRAVPLGRGATSVSVAALMPFSSFDELQPVFGLLAGTPESAALDLTLIAARGVVEEVLDPLMQAFRFYGLSGRVVIVPPAAKTSTALDIAVQATAAEEIVLWSPHALPKASGWLGSLQAEKAALRGPGLISPVLTYEDGSIRFGPPGAEQGSTLGYGRGWLVGASTVPVPVAASDVLLVSRAVLSKAGGFDGPVLGDAYAHIDLSRRCAAEGIGIWCSSAVEFWSLDNPASENMGPIARILRRVDARLLALRGAVDPEAQLI